ncbi:MAG: hypothetical protein HY303_13590, partial [Candidatus Wallbacteria bacterium]|nr:hypothetical protein [Candidatus Wallbacteria bacterium]
TATLQGGSLTFSNSAGLTPASPALPPSLASNATATVVFDVAIGAGAAPGPRTVSINITAADANSGADISKLLVAAGNLTILTPALIAVGTVQAPATVSRGQVFTAVVAVSNNGQSDATVSSAYMVLNDSAITLAPASYATTVPGLQTVNLSFTVTVGGTSVLGAHTVNFNLFGSDATSNAVLAVNNQNIGSINVVAPGALVITGSTIPATVSIPQQFSVNVAVQNTGGNTLINLQPVLGIAPAQAALTFQQRPGNPTTLNAGASGNFIWDVTVGSTATNLQETVSLDITGTDIGLGTPGLLVRQPTLAFIQVQTQANFTNGISAISAPLTVTQGQLYTQSFTISNRGQATANLTNVTLSFAGGGVSAVAAAGNPVTIASNTTPTFNFNVTVAGNAPTGAHQATVNVAATDANSLAVVTGNLANAGSVVVQTPAALNVLPMISSASNVSLGQTFRVTVPVSNQGEARADISGNLLQFSGSGLTVVAASPPPATIPGLQTVSYEYTVTVALGAAQNTRTALFSIFGTDGNAGTALAVNQQNVGSVTVVAPGALAVGNFSGASTVTQGQLFTVQVGVQNTGQNTVTNLAPVLKYTPSDLTPTLRAPAPTQVTGGQIVTFIYDVAVGNAPTIGVHSTAFTVTGVEPFLGTLTQTLQPSPSVTVQTQAAIAVAPLANPATLTASKGQLKQFSYIITNTGGASGATATIQAASLTFANMTDIQVAVQTLPPAVAAGATATVVFNVTVGPNSVPGNWPATVSITAADANSGANVSQTNSTTAGGLTIQTPAALSVGAFVDPSPVSISQTFNLVVPVQNTGQASATITTAFMVFSGNNMFANVTGPQTTIPGLSSRNITLQVTVLAGATPGARTGSFSIFGFDANSNAGISVSNQNVGTITLVTPAALTVVGTIIPANVSQSQVFNLTVNVKNTGGNTAQSLSSGLVVAGMSTTPSGSNPTTLAAGVTAPFVYSVTVPGGALGSQTVGITMTGNDISNGLTVTPINQNVGSFTVQTAPIVSTISVIASQTNVTQGQTFNISLTVQNTGQATANLSGVALTFSANGVTAAPSGSNPTTLSGNQIGTFNYTGSVTGGATVGTHTASVTVTGTDANSGSAFASGIRANAGNVNVQTAPSLSFTSYTGPTSGTQGQSGISHFLNFTNSGGADANITNATLTFGASGVNSSLVAPINVTVAGGGGGATIGFTTSIPLGATPGFATVTGGASGTDANSGAAVNGSGAVGTFQVQTPPSMQIGDVQFKTVPTGIDRAGSEVNPVTVTITVTNGTSANVATAHVSNTTVLTLGAGQFSVSNPGNLNTLQIAGGTSTTFDFTVTALTAAVTAQTVNFSANVTLQDAGGNTSSQSAATSWVVRNQADNVTAQGVKGQGIFSGGSANRGGSAGANTLNTPGGVATDGTNVVVADTANNRVLVFTSLGATTASKIIGQANNTATASGSGSAGLNAPEGVAIDASGRVVVTDTGNNRVLVFASIGSLPQFGAVAILAFGQPDVNSNQPNQGNAAPDGTTLNLPEEAWVDTTNDTLFIADTFNSRVLIFTGYDALVTAGTMPVTATRVVGQANNTGQTSNRGGAVGLGTLSFPASVATTGTRLAIADAGNNRVLVYNDLTAITTDGKSADGALGQALASDASPDRGGASPVQNGLDSPMGVRYGNASLFISDTVNNRVVIYDRNATDGSVATATDLIGQALYTTKTQNNTVSGSVDAFGLKTPKRSATIGAGNVFYVADQDNHRVLRFPVP